LFVTFGNGFRYGRRYLFGCQMLSISSATTVSTKQSFIPRTISRNDQISRFLNSLYQNFV